jgi:plastocyanin
VVRGVVLALVAAAVLGGLFFALRPDPPDAGPRNRAVEVEIRGGEMDPAEITVGEGDRVTLRATSDRPVEMHLHGYDRELKVEPGGSATLSFEAEKTGRFEIEAEGSGVELGTLVVEPRRGG